MTGCSDYRTVVHCPAPRADLITGLIPAQGLMRAGQTRYNSIRLGVTEALATIQTPYLLPYLVPDHLRVASVVFSLALPSFLAYGASPLASQIAHQKGACRGYSQITHQKVEMQSNHRIQACQAPP